MPVPSRVSCVRVCVRVCIITLIVVVYRHGIGNIKGDTVTRDVIDESDEHKV